MKMAKRSSYVVSFLKGTMAKRFATKERCDWITGSELGFTGAERDENDAKFSIFNDLSFAETLSSRQEGF